MATEKRAPVSKAQVMAGIVAGSAEGLDASKVAEKLGMTKPSFVQAMNALRKEHKLLKEAGKDVGDFPALADGRSARKGQKSGNPTAAQSAILAALGQAGSVEPESDESESAEVDGSEEVTVVE